jgi:hypothetical protein
LRFYPEVSQVTCSPGPLRRHLFPSRSQSAQCAIHLLPFLWSDVVILLDQPTMNRFVHCFDALAQFRGVVFEQSGLVQV